MKKYLPFLLMLCFIAPQVLNSQTIRHKKVILQGFWWDYKNTNFPNGWANYLAELAPRLKQLGIDGVWIPPSYKNQSPTWVGYGPMDHYDLGDKFQKGSPTTPTGMGTKDEFLRMIAVMHANGIEVIQDIVLNHVDGAGTTTGAGGQDPAPKSAASNAGYKNFRYSCYATPALDESQNDYWTRRGRWSKNYENFHPNENNNCTTGDICAAFFGPDIDFTPKSASSANPFGLSSNIPTSGAPSGYPATRPFFNPQQSSNYMYDESKNWISWFKKQTDVDGFRWDAVKHFPIYIGRDLTYHTKYNLGSFNGGYSMTNIGEWIGGNNDLQNYVNGMSAAALGHGPEEHTGTFDFNLRGYGSGGSLFDMVTANISGGYDLSNLPDLQQFNKFQDYTSPSARVHRTVPFVNSHDTYRPYLVTTPGATEGNFLKPIGDATGWNTGQELGGKGQHIDPREPRMAAAYAVIAALDGNPMIFFEDIFNIGTTGKRWSHQPTNTTDLPTWNDIDNIIQCHQKLQFKEGNRDYSKPVPSNRTTAFFPDATTTRPFNNKTNHLIIERTGRVLVGINDQFSNDVDTWVDSEFAPGTILMDYSGANGTTTSVVQNDKRVYIKTKAVNHGISGVYGHGYSVWAAVPNNTPFTSVADMFAYLNYTPQRAAQSTQEWEMDNDLGDSHCASLGQGGRTPDMSPNDRVAGKIFVDANTTVSYSVSLGTSANSLTLDFYTLDGTLLASKSGSGTTITGSFSNTSTRWITIKIRNTNANVSGQKCFVKVSYAAPSVVSTSTYPAATTVSLWTSNGGSNDWNDCRNWEEGKIPACNGTVIIPHKVKVMPTVAACFTGTFINRSGLTLKAKAFLQGAFTPATGLMYDSLRVLNLIPLATPYGGTETTTPSVFAVSGNDAIVDWVKIELRDKTVFSNIITTRSALLQRDGDIVETDGVSPLYFEGITTDNYFLAIKHRNHLGTMAASSQAFLETPLSINFNSTPTFGTNGQKNIGGTFCLWAGDASGNGEIRYNSTANDKNAILGVVGLTSPNNIVAGYHNADVNLDGKVKYNGGANDKNVILSNVGLTTPNNLVIQNF